MSNTTTKIIRNAEFFWAKLDTPVNPFGAGDAWELQIRTNSEETATEWALEHINVKKHDEGYFYANLKRYAQSPKTGKKYAKPIIVGKEKEKIEGVMIGNGSKGNVKVFQYDYSNAGKSGTATQFVAVQVTDLIEYKADEIIDF